MQLPRIQSIDTHTTDVPRTPARPTAGFSTTTALRLSASRMPTPSLWVLLRAPIALTRFWYVAVDTANTPCLRELREGLQLQRYSLEFLHLHLVRLTLSDDDALFDTPAVWPALRTLSCSAREQRGARGGGLEKLCAVRVERAHGWEDGGVVEEVVALVRMKEVVVPLLERVAVSRMDGGEWARVGRACGEAWVVLVGDGDEEFVW